MSAQKIVTRLSTIALALLTVLGLENQIQQILLSRFGISTEISGEYINILIILLVVILLLIVPVAALAGFFMSLTINPDLRQSFCDTEVSLCEEADLVEIYKQANRQFGPRASDLRTIQKLFKHCPSMYWKVKSNGLCGYFVIMPLTKMREAAIREGHFYGASPSPQHLGKNINKCKAVYIGAVVGVGVRGRAGALSGLTCTVQTLNCDRVYAKAIVKDGLRLVKKYKFTRLDDGSQNYELEQYYLLERKPSAAKYSIQPPTAIPA